MKCPCADALGAGLCVGGRSVVPSVASKDPSALAGNLQEIAQLPKRILTRLKRGFAKLSLEIRRLAHSAKMPIQKGSKIPSVIMLVVLGASRSLAMIRRFTDLVSKTQSPSQRHHFAKN